LPVPAAHVALQRGRGAKSRWHATHAGARAAKVGEGGGGWMLQLRVSRVVAICHIREARPKYGIHPCVPSAQDRGGRGDRGDDLHTAAASCAARDRRQYSPTVGHSDRRPLPPHRGGRSAAAQTQRMGTWSHPPPSLDVSSLGGGRRSLTGRCTPSKPWAAAAARAHCHMRDMRGAASLIWLLLRLTGRCTPWTWAGAAARLRRRGALRSRPRREPSCARPRRA